LHEVKRVGFILGLILSVDGYPVKEVTVKFSNLVFNVLARS